MLPLNDTEQNRYSGFPFATVFLIAINTAVEIGKPLYLSRSLSDFGYWEFLMRFAFTPELVLALQGPGILSNFTSMFLHGDFFHLLGNMGALWVFGRRVEDACGSIRFLVFYLLAGTCANILTTLVLYDSNLPSLGASGAIFGVMGAYLLLYPAGKIRTLVMLSVVPTWPKVRAGWVVLYFVALQVIPAINVLFFKSDYNIAYWAHLGGFFSAITIFLFLRPEAFARYISDTAV